MAVCGRQYVFNAKNRDLDPARACPPLDVPENIRTAVARKAQQDEQLIQIAAARLEAGGTGAPQSPNVQVARAQTAQTASTAAASTNATTAQDGTQRSLMSRIPALRIPGFGNRRASPVATTTQSAVTSYTGSVPAGAAIDPFAVFDMFVTVDARTLPKTLRASRGDEDAAGTR